MNRAQRNSLLSALALILISCSHRGGAGVAATIPTTGVTANDAPFAFAEPQTTSVGDDPADLAMADFDGDGSVDLATANFASGDATIVSNASQSTGSLFGASATAAVMTSSASLAVADFDEDSSEDLVVLDRASGYARFLRNTTSPGAAPSFTLAGNAFNASPTPWMVIAEDLNGDGHKDVAASNDGSIVILGSRNTGMRSRDPHFRPSRVQPDLTLAAGSATGPLLAADLDGDGKLDLAAASMTQNQVFVFANNGIAGAGFSFASASTFSVGAGPVDMAVGDLNGDGLPDLALACQTGEEATVLVNQGGQSFAPISIAAPGTTPISIALVDMDRDGLPDLLLGDAQSQTILVRLNRSAQGVLAFDPNWIAQPLGSKPDKIRVVDWNSDGHIDLVTTSRENDSVTVMTGSP